MQTNNLSLQMLLQNQASADIILNESLLKIDSFIFSCAIDFLNFIPTNAKDGDIYIFSESFEKPERSNNVGLYSSSKGWNFFQPKSGWRFFIQNANSYKAFLNNSWVEDSERQCTDWNSTSGVTAIQNKPILFDGNYNSLQNKPNLFSGKYDDLQGKPTATTSASGEMPILGDYKQSAQGVDHGKWLLCNGQAISRLTYSTLFTLIGTAFGVGDGIATFNLPDSRAKVNASIGRGTFSANRSIGVTIGEESHTLTVDEIPSHAHDIARTTSRLFGEFGFGGLNNIMSGDKPSVITNVTTNKTQYIQNTGGGRPHNIMQPTIFIGNTFIYSGV